MPCRVGDGLLLVFVVVLALAGGGLFGASLRSPVPMLTSMAPNRGQTPVGIPPTMVPTPTPLATFTPVDKAPVVMVAQSLQQMGVFRDDPTHPIVVLDPCETILRTWYCRPKVSSPSGVGND